MSAGACFVDHTTVSAELARELAAGSLTVTEIAGMAYNPLTDDWRLARDTAVNYMVFAVKG